MKAVAAVIVIAGAIPIAMHAATFSGCGPAPTVCELAYTPSPPRCTADVPLTTEVHCTAPITNYSSATGFARARVELFRQWMTGRFAFARADPEDWYWNVRNGVPKGTLITSDSVGIGGTMGDGTLRLTFVFSGSAGGTETSIVGTTKLSSNWSLYAMSRGNGIYASLPTPGTLVVDVPFRNGLATFEWGIIGELNRNAGFYDVGMGARGSIDFAAALVSAEVVGVPNATIISSTGEPYPGSGELKAPGPDGCACGKHETIPIDWTIAGGSAMLAATGVELDKWNRYASVFGARTSGTGPFDEDGTNQIGFLSDGDIDARYGFRLGPSISGYTVHSPQSSFGNFDRCPLPAAAVCGEFFETDVLINSDAAGGWTFDGPPPLDGSGPNHYGATALHELGHALGLHHSFQILSAMNYQKAFAGRYLTLADASALRAHYGPQTNAIVDLAAYPFRHNGGHQWDGIVVASVTPQTVAPGTTLTLRDFRIENVGTAPAASTVLNVYLSEDAAIDSSDHWIGRLEWSTFADGSFWDSEGWNFVIPADTPSGTYYVGAIATIAGAEDAVAYNNRWILDASRRVTVAGGRAPAVFTDDPLAVRNTAIKSQHIAELRSLVNTRRAAHSLPPYVFSEPIARGSIIRAAHVRELRAAVDELRGASGLPPIAYAHSLVASGIVHATDLAEIRNALR